jgi:hypothetical protein
MKKRILISPFCVILIISQTIFAIATAQTAIVIPANEAAAHVNEYETLEGVVAKVFTSKNGNTFLNIGATYSNQTFTGWIPNSSPVKDSAVLNRIEGSTSQHIVHPLVRNRAAGLSW